MAVINTALVFRKLSDDEWSKVLSESASVIAYEFFTNAPSNSSVQLCHIENELKKQVNARVLKELISFASVKIDGNLLMEKLKYQDAYLWYYHRFRIYHHVRQSYHLIETIKKYLDEQAQLSIYTDDRNVKNFFEDHSNVQIITSEIIESSPKTSKCSLLVFGLKFAIRGIRGRLRLGQIRKRKHLLLVNNNLLPQQKRSHLDYNPYYADVLTKGDPKDWGILQLNPLPKLEMGLSSWKKEVSIKNSPYPQINSECIIFFYGIANYKKLKEIGKFLKGLLNDKAQIEKQLTPIHKLFYFELLRLNSSSKLYLFQYVCFRAFFRRTKFNTVNTISEHSSNERCVLDAAKSNNIYTVGFQHGLIAQMNVSYIYGEYESMFNPLPSQTILWGENSRDILIQYSCYTTKNTHVLGQPRTDIIHKIVQSKNRIEIPGVKENVPIVVFSTQPQKDESLRKQAALDVIALAREFPEVQFIFKLHPAESKSYYQKLLDETSKVLIFNQEMDLYQLLALQSAHITCFSTVGAEAVYFGSPLITIDPLEEDIAHYAENGIAIRVKNTEELKTAFATLLGNGFKSSLDTQRFIEKNAYKIDGKVAERYLDYIDSLIK